MVEALRDTGADTFVARRDLVPTTRYSGRTVSITIAETTYKKDYPVVEIDVETPFYTGRVEAIDMDSPVVHLSIGNRVLQSKPRKTVLPVYGVAPGTLTSHGESGGSCSPEGAGSSKVDIAVTTRAQEARANRPFEPLASQTELLGTVRPEDLRQAQCEDATLASCRLLGEETSSRKSGKFGMVSFSYVKGFLYRHYTAGEETYRQVVVPKKCRTSLLRLAHESLMGGHLGAKKTRDRVWQQFFWPGVCTDVRRFVASCDRCQKVSPKGRAKKVPVGKMPLIDEPFRRVAVDFVGPISPLSERGNRYILTIVDYGKRYPEAVPLKGIEAERVAEALWDIWTRTGIPREVLTDRGTQFMSDVTQQVNLLLSIKGMATTPYHAQCNGLVERFNGTLKTMLRKLCQERPKEWNRYLPALLFAYREVPQESLGFSPFELLYGRRVRGPMAVLRQLWTEEDEPEEVRTAAEDVVDLRNRLKETYELAQKNLREASSHYTTALNRHTVNRTFKVTFEAQQARAVLARAFPGPCAGW